MVPLPTLPPLYIPTIVLMFSIIISSSSFIKSSNSTLARMASQQLQKQVANMRDALFKQGYLDEQFVQLEELSDDANPNFVEEVVTLFFNDSLRMINNIEQTLEKSPLDFEKLDKHTHQFKGSSSSIGAAKVKSESQQLREYCKEGNADGCSKSFQQMKREYATLRKKLESYFQLARLAGPGETATRPM